MAYLVNFGHLFLVHYFAWFSVIIFIRIKEKPLKLNKIKDVLKEAALSASIIGILSSFSHNHFKHFLG